MRLIPILIFTKTLLLAPWALSAGDPYGKFFVATDAFWAEETLPAASERSPEERPLDSDLLIQTLAEQLQQQEYRDGPYAVSLAETLGQLARAQESAGATDAARGSRERALHLIRVNEGLYSPAQRPLLRAMLNSLRRDGEFRALDERYDYFFRLYGSGRPPFEGLRWSATLEYLRWQREALRRELDGNPADRLLRLHSLHEDIFDALTAEGMDVDLKKRTALTFSHLKTLYLLEDLVKPPPTFREQNNRFGARDPRDFDLQQERLENMQRTLRGSARRLLEGLLEVTPPQDTEARAVAQLALADWLQWYGSSREANALYEAIWADLHRAGFASLAEEWFARPVALPDNGVFFESGLRAAEGPVNVRLSVRENGRGSATTVDVREELKRAARRLQRRVSVTRYRPAIQNGRIIGVKDLPMAYWVFKP